MKCLDTSVLIYAADTASPHHGRAVEFLEQSVSGKWAACVCEQSLHEFAALTTSERFARRPLAPVTVEKMIERLTRYPQPVVLYSDDAILRRAFKLMEKNPARITFGAAHLAATMLAHGVKTLVTPDRNAFAALREIGIENPFETLFA
ncbi:MAG TPA: type II toxin-antitoxin system VapC family toxin [bacterium]|jgi:predicted nucleic acid-binding protein